jgi:uncharacterized protein
MRFVVDRHLGHLARWLRTFGYDAFFEVDASADRMRAEVTRSETLFVTTESAEAQRFGAPTLVLVPKEDLRAQLRALQRELPEPLDSKMFTRCVLCNVPVVPASKETVRDKVPAAVFDRTDHYTACPSCRRIYWEGTHTARLRKRLAELLETDEGGGGGGPTERPRYGC